MLTLIPVKSIDKTISEFNVKSSMFSLFRDTAQIINVSRCRRLKSGLFKVSFKLGLNYVRLTGVERGCRRGFSEDEHGGVDGRCVRVAGRSSVAMSPTVCQCV